MNIVRWHNKPVNKDNLWQAWIIAEKAGIFLGQIRFINKEPFLSNESLKMLIQTKEEIFTEFQVSGSENLLEALKDTKKEIVYLLEAVLTNQDQKERKKLINLSMKWDFLTKEQKKIELINIKTILNDLDHFSKHRKDEKSQQRIENFKKTWKFYKWT